MRKNELKEVTPYILHLFKLHIDGRALSRPRKRTGSCLKDTAAVFDSFTFHVLTNFLCKLLAFQASVSNALLSSRSTVFERFCAV